MYEYFWGREEKKNVMKLKNSLNTNEWSTFNSIECNTVFNLMSSSLYNWMEYSNYINEWSNQHNWIEYSVKLSTLWETMLIDWPGTLPTVKTLSKLDPELISEKISSLIEL